MTTVHKYIMEITDSGITTVKMPKDAIILTVGNQRENLCLWVKVDTGEPLCDREFLVAGTGHPLDGDEKRALLHRGTALMSNGNLVLHVFEIFIIPF